MKTKWIDDKKQTQTSISRTFLDWLKTINFIIKNNKNE